MAIKGIDCSTPLTKDTAQALYGLGYRFAGRYLVPDKYPKQLSTEEAHILSDTGLLILSVFETTADRARGGAASGTNDGLLAYQAAQKIGMPSGATVFFAVDFDASNNDMNTVEAYLRAAAKQNAGYKTGVYGSYSVIETMAARGACEDFWQAYAWSGGKRSDKATIYQYQYGITEAGVSVDINEATSEEGLWNYYGNGSAVNMTIEEARRALTALDGTGSAHSAWADEAVSKLTAAGVFKGDGNGNFGWEQNVTREALAQILYTMLGAIGMLDKL